MSDSNMLRITRSMSRSQDIFSEPSENNVAHELNFQSGNYQENVDKQEHLLQYVILST